MPLFIPDYNQLPIHKLMLSDSKRVRCYASAIRSMVNENSIVVDIGSGTGILSIIAAKAGAKKVYAIERAKISELSKRLFEENGVQDTVELIAADSRDVELPEKADIIVSEWMGVHVFQENMLPTFIDARKRMLKGGGRLIPEEIKIFIAPLNKNPIYEDEINKWKNPFDGISFEELSVLSSNDEYICNVPVDILTHKGVKAYNISMYSIEEQDAYKMKADFYFENESIVEGICGWFIAELSDGIILDTSPGSGTTHWQHTIYPFYNPVEIKSDENLCLELLAEPRDAYTELSWCGYVKERKEETFMSHSTKNNYTFNHT